MAVNFVSIPDPRRGPCSIEIVENAQRYGAIPSSVTPFASKEHWIREAQHQWPSEVAVVTPRDGAVGKVWAHRGARVGNGEKFTFIFWTGNNMTVEQLPHSGSASIYSLHVVNFYKEFSKHFSNGVPELVTITLDGAEAARLNFADKVYLPFPVGEGNELRASIALRLNAQTGLLEWFDINEFMAENKSDVQAGRTGAAAGTLTWSQISAGVSQYYTIAAAWSDSDEVKAAKFYAAAKR